MANERGSYLPFVLFIWLLIFSSVTTMIAIYKNESVIAYQLWEHMKAETIAEMTKKKFASEDFTLLNEAGEMYYTFPSGGAFIRYERVTANKYLLKLKIQTDRDEFIFIRTLVIVPSEGLE